jgi:aminoglycoside phosphotransferase (APT) family kinase protein
MAPPLVSRSTEPYVNRVLNLAGLRTSENGRMAEENSAEVVDEPHALKSRTDRSSYEAALTEWFARRVPGATDVVMSDLKVPVATGFSNETVLFSMTWSVDGVRLTERFVGRIEPVEGGLFPVQTSATSVSVALQHRIMETVAATTSVPIPTTIGYEPDTAVLGQPFFVMEFIEGRVPGDRPRYTESGFLVDEATPAERRRMVESGLAQMAAIHQIDWLAAGLEWLDPSGTGSPTMSHQLALYRRFVVDVLRGREHPVIMAALDWLDENDPHDDRVGLSWGDARLGNIIWQNYEAAAVLDWEACALCPTEADVGWWLMFDRTVFDDVGIDRLEGFPTRDEMIAHYELVSGREVRNAHYWEVFGLMRFCAIYILLGDRMVAAGALPLEHSPSVANPVTESLARMLRA